MQLEDLLSTPHPYVQLVLQTAAQAQTTQNPGTGVAATPAGQQFAVSDAPTSGDTAGASQRPALSGSALSAYQAGMQAFQAGDLQGAKNQFVAATQADPKAYQAYYSLGVVRERLNESSGAVLLSRLCLCSWWAE